MDAYDIFKKLTKGLTFKQRVLGVKTNVSSKPLPVKKEELEIKDELPSEDEEEIQNGSTGEASEVDSEDDNELQVLEGVKVAEKKKKKKKERTEDLLKKLEIEEHNRFRNEHGIKVVGRHIPAALQDFSELVTKYNVKEALVDIVTRCGYDEPTPVQRQAVPCMLEERQILACAPTGSGKTCAFLLPILHTLGAPQGGPRALVLCPTRELAHQIYREALRLSEGTELRCSVVRNMKESKVKEREATIRRSDIVISTPNRLCYLLNRDNVNISLDKVRWLIIDEADKLFEGSTDDQSDFRQQMEQVLAACGGKQRRIAMFSATHTPAVAKWCRHHMRGLINVTVGQRNAATTLVDQELLYCGNENGKLVAFRQLVQQGLKPPVLGVTCFEYIGQSSSDSQSGVVSFAAWASHLMPDAAPLCLSDDDCPMQSKHVTLIMIKILFVQSKDRAKQLFKELIYDGINVDVIHADRTQAQRDNVVRSFRVGRVWVLICTELMGRGIDFRGVNLVINYDFPPSAIAYIHRIGRAGRAGHKGRAVTFFTQDDVANLRSIASVMKQSGCAVPDYMLALKQNPNKRKKLAKKAPRREEISTILGKRPDKRKLENDKDSKDDKTKDKGHVNAKRRKIDKKTEKGEQSTKKFKKMAMKNNKKMNTVKKNKKKTVVHKKVKYCT